MKTILVVEDELSIRSFVCLNLRKKDMRFLKQKPGKMPWFCFRIRPFM